jgi:propionyl-CoA carboxylase alpha chain
MEMNTRLQVEHPVTELVTGTDLVALQIAVAEGRELGEEPGEPHGHAVEVRLYAEDPADDWAPQTGTIRAFDFPDGPGIRIDSAVEAGSTVGIHYDAMIAKVVAHGPDRATAVRLLADVLRRARVHGVVTNAGLLLGILEDEEFQAARVHTALLDERLDDWSAPVLDEHGLALASGAAALAHATAAAAASPVLSHVPAAFRNVPSQPRTRRYVLSTGSRTEVSVSYTSERGRLALNDLDGVRVVSASPTRVVLDDHGVATTFDVTVGESTVDVDGPDGSATFEVLPEFVDPADVVAEGSLLAPMPAAVVSVAVESGQQVAKGDVVVVLEAMKMQHTITAPTDGVVSELDVSAGAQVESGTVLAVITPEGEAS